jgi:hypothetical protein
MPTCYVCGGDIEFRYIGGRPVPIHLDGPCSGEHQATQGPQYSKSDESCCYLTTCPECKCQVYFIRHNGGSVWVDPPLGPPWYKHYCMDSTSTGQGKQVVAAATQLASSSQLGVATATEVARSGSLTVVRFETGNRRVRYLLIRGNGTSLIGQIVAYDSRGEVQPISDNSGAFVVMARLGDTHEFTCPECGLQVSSLDMSEHLRVRHGFSIFSE